MIEFKVSLILILKYSTIQFFIEFYDGETLGKVAGGEIYCLLLEPGKSYTGEGWALKNLKNQFVDQREDSLTSLEVYYLL